MEGLTRGQCPFRALTPTQELQTELLAAGIPPLAIQGRPPRFWLGSLLRCPLITVTGGGQDQLFIAAMLPFSIVADQLSIRPRAPPVGSPQRGHPLIYIPVLESDPARAVFDPLRSCTLA
jgi:hypothetical protein